MTALPVLFVCVPQQSMRLTRTSCGKRHLASAEPGTGRGFMVRDETCRTCVIGAAHAKGEAPDAWSDGAPIAVGQVGTGQPPATKPSAAVVIQRTQTPTQKHIASPAPLTVPTPKEIAMPHEKTLTFNGKTQTIQAWADEIGIGKEALRMRLRADWTLERALTTDGKVAGAPITKGRRLTKLGRARDAAAFERDRAAVVEAVTATAMDVPAPPRTTLKKLAAGIESESLAPERFIAEPADELLRQLGYKVTTLYAPKGLLLLVEAS